MKRPSKEAMDNVMRDVRHRVRNNLATGKGRPAQVTIVLYWNGEDLEIAKVIYDAWIGRQSREESSE